LAASLSRARSVGGLPGGGIQPSKLEKGHGTSSGTVSQFALKGAPPRDIHGGELVAVPLRHPRRNTTANRCSRRRAPPRNATPPWPFSPWIHASQSRKSIQQLRTQVCMMRPDPSRLRPTLASTAPALPPSHGPRCCPSGLPEMTMQPFTRPWAGVARREQRGECCALPAYLARRSNRAKRGGARHTWDRLHQLYRLSRTAPRPSWPGTGRTESSMSTDRGWIFISPGQR
jgi:hypothetical protein